MISLRKGLSTIPLVASLYRMPEASPESITDFVFHKDIIHPLQVKSELRRFAEIVARMRPKGVMEIGTCRGGTLLVMARLSDPAATIVSVDLPGGPYGGGYQWFRAPIFRRFIGREQRLHLIRGDSHSAITFENVSAAFRSCDLDLLFIDGDHSYAGVKRDFELYRPLVRPGGIVAFHDIAEHPPESCCDVSRFWAEVKSQYEHDELIEDRAQGWAGIGLLYVE